MSVIIRLQGLSWSASASDIRNFFTGLSIPPGGVRIIGGEKGDAFIAFSTDEDARRAMMMSNKLLNDGPVQLFLSSKTEMQNTIQEAKTVSTPVASTPNVEPQLSSAVNMPPQQYSSPPQQQSYPATTQPAPNIPALSSPALASLTQLHGLLPSNITQALGILANANLNSTTLSQLTAQPTPASAPNSQAATNMPGEYSVGGINNKPPANQGQITSSAHNNFNNSNIMGQSQTYGQSFPAQGQYPPQQNALQQNAQRWGTPNQQPFGNNPPNTGSNRFPVPNLNNHPNAAPPNTGQNRFSGPNLNNPSIATPNTGQNRFPGPNQNLQYGNQNRPALGNQQFNQGQQGNTAPPFGGEKPISINYGHGHQQTPTTMIDSRLPPFGQQPDKGQPGGFGQVGNRQFPGGNPQTTGSYGYQGGPPKPQDTKPPFGESKPSFDSRSGVSDTRGPPRPGNRQNPSSSPFNQGGSQARLDQNPYGQDSTQRPGENSPAGPGLRNNGVSNTSQPTNQQSRPTGTPSSVAPGQPMELDEFGRIKRSSSKTDMAKSDKSKGKDDEKRDRSRRDSPRDRDRRDRDRDSRDSRRRDRDDDRRTRRDRERSDRGDKDRDRSSRRDRDSDRRDRSRDTDRKSPNSDSDRRSKKRSLSPSSKTEDKDKKLQTERPSQSRDAPITTIDAAGTLPTKTVTTSSGPQPLFPVIQPPDHSKGLLGNPPAHIQPLIPLTAMQMRPPQVPFQVPGGPSQNMPGVRPPFPSQGPVVFNPRAAPSELPRFQSPPQMQNPEPRQSCFDPVEEKPTNTDFHQGQPPMKPEDGFRSPNNNIPPFRGTKFPRGEPRPFDNRGPIDMPPRSRHFEDKPRPALLSTPPDAPDEGHLPSDMRGPPGGADRPPFDRRPDMRGPPNRLNPFSRQQDFMDDDFRGPGGPDRFQAGRGNQPPFNDRNPNVRGPAALGMPENNRDTQDTLRRGGPPMDNRDDRYKTHIDDRHDFRDRGGFHDRGPEDFDRRRGPSDMPRRTLLGNPPIPANPDFNRPQGREREFEGPPRDIPFDGPARDMPFDGPRRDGPFDGPSQDRPFNGPNRDKPYDGPPHDRPFDGPPRDRPFEGPNRDRPFDGPNRDRPFDGSPRDRPFDGPNRDRPFDGPAHDRPFDGPNRARPFNGTNRDRPFDGPNQERPFEGPNRDRPFDGPPGDRPFDGPPRDRPFDGPNRDRPIDGPPRDRQFDGSSWNRPFDGPPGDRPFDRPPQDRPFDGPSRDRPFDGFNRNRPFDGPNRDRPFDGLNRDRPFDGPNQDRLFDDPNRNRPFDGPRDRSFDGPYQDRPFDGPNQDRPFDGPEREMPFGGPNRDRSFDRQARDRPIDGPSRDQPFDSLSLDGPNRDRFDGRNRERPSDYSNRGSRFDSPNQERSHGGYSRDKYEGPNRDRCTEGQNRGGSDSDLRRRQDDRLGRSEQRDRNRSPPTSSSRSIDVSRKDIGDGRRSRDSRDKDDSRSRGPDSRLRPSSGRDQDRREESSSQRSSRQSSDSSDKDKKTGTQDPSSSAMCSVLVDNLAIDTTYKEIRRFFNDAEIVKDGIKLVNDKNGKRVGKAYIRFASQDDYKRAMAKNRLRLLGKPMAIKQVPGMEYDLAEDDYHPETFVDNAERSRQIDMCNTLSATIRNLKGQSNLEPPTSIQPQKPEDWVMKITMLPHDTTVDKVRSFFKGCEIAKGGEAIFLESDHKHCCTGLCYVEFANADSYRKAMALKRVFCGRTIAVSPGNMGDVEDLVNRMKRELNASSNEASKSEKTTEHPVTAKTQSDSKKNNTENKVSERPEIESNENVKKDNRTAAHEASETLSEARPVSPPLPSNVAVIRMKNIPDNFNGFTVRSLFDGIGVNIFNIQLPHDAVGKKVGEAFADLGDVVSVKKGLAAKDLPVCKEKNITMTAITKGEMINLLRDFRQCVQPEPPTKQDVFYFVKAANLPKNVKTGELMTFFSGFQPAPESIRLNVPDAHQPPDSSTALVGFRMREDAERAVQNINSRPLRNRPVSLAKVII